MRLIHIKVANPTRLEDKELSNELIRFEETINNTGSKLRFHVYEDPWISLKEDKPEEGVIVVCYNEDWIEDHNPKGLKCLYREDDMWYYDNDNLVHRPPTHWHKLICSPVNADCLC